MKQFVFHGVDRAGGSDLRAATRQAHAAYQAVRSNPVGGPLLDADGAACGTLIVFDAPDLATAEALVADDPYVLAGLFATAVVHEFHAVDWPT
jgi:uncharacterized protein YciI